MLHFKNKNCLRFGFIIFNNQIIYFRLDIHFFLVFISQIHNHSLGNLGDWVV